MGPIVIGLSIVRSEPDGLGEIHNGLCEKCCQHKSERQGVFDEPHFSLHDRLGCGTAQGGQNHEGSGGRGCRAGQAGVLVSKEDDLQGPCLDTNRSVAVGDAFVTIFIYHANESTPIVTLNDSKSMIVKLISSQLNTPLATQGSMRMDSQQSLNAC